MITVTIAITAHTSNDIVDALHRVVAELSAGSQSGGTENETQSYEYQVTGTPVVAYALVPKRGNHSPAPQRYDSVVSARAAVSSTDCIVGLASDGTVIAVVE